MSTCKPIHLLWLCLLFFPTLVGIDCTGPQGPAGLDGVDGVDGQDGQDGQDGADGQLRIYGDGSAGARTISSDEDWTTVGDAPTNLQFTNLTIEATGAIIIPSGMTIRCTGTFTNNGIIFVENGASGVIGSQTGAAGDFSAVIVPPNAGVGQRAAQAGDTGDDSVTRFGGHGAVGIGEFEARQILDPGMFAGGGGAPGGSDLVSGVTRHLGCNGGGSIRILARGAIVNASGANITANGQSANNVQSGGGGGGGIVILASPTSINNSGAISVTGGDGEDGDTNEAGSGGGGGGIIHLLAPVITNLGTTDASGGDAGQDTNGASNNSDRGGGGGGGSCAGTGGDGGDLPPGLNGEDGNGGVDGRVLETEVDPTALF